LDPTLEGSISPPLGQMPAVELVEQLDLTAVVLAT
jgi:hypothetical protein